MRGMIDPLTGSAHRAIVHLPTVRLPIVRRLTGHRLTVLRSIGHRISDGVRRTVI